MRSWRELEFLAPREQRALQNRLLRRFVEERLYPFSPWYHELFDRHGIRADRIRRVEDLAEVPFTSKRDLLPSLEDPDRPRRFVLQPSPEAIRAWLPGPAKLRLLARTLALGKRRLRARLRSEYYPIFMTFTTGRSALPIPFFFSRHDLDNLSQSGYRLCDVLRFEPEQRGLNLFPYAPHLAFWQVAFGGFASECLVMHTGGGKVAGTEGNLRALDRMQPNVLMGVPGYLYHLLREARQRNLRLASVKTVVLGADRVPPGLKLKLRQLLAELGSDGIQVLGTYGFTEARMAFGECPAPDGTSSGYHVYPDQGIFEVVDPRTGEVLPEEADGELVYTPLQGRGTTIFRYRTGDIVEGGIRSGPCPFCKRTTPRISSRLSRATSVHAVNLRKIKGTTVNMEELGQILADDVEVEEWQIELRKKDDDPLELDELRLYVALRQDASRALAEDRLRRTIHAHAEISPDEICFLDLPSLLDRVGMERELKEKRFVDARPAEPVTEGRP